MRLTSKANIYLNGKIVENVYVKKQGSFGEYDPLYNKLGQYEDLEEELGIDLHTLVKIFADGFYALIEDDEHDKPYLFHFDARDLELCIEGQSIIVYMQYSNALYGEYNFKDYGKTWALTKEELINEIY